MFDIRGRLARWEPLLAFVVTASGGAAVVANADRAVTHPLYLPAVLAGLCFFLLGALNILMNKANPAGRSILLHASNTGTVFIGSVAAATLHSFPLHIAAVTSVLLAVVTMYRGWILLNHR